MKNIIAFVLALVAVCLFSACSADYEKSVGAGDVIDNSNWIGVERGAPSVDFDDDDYDKDDDKDGDKDDLCEDLKKMCKEDDDNPLCSLYYDVRCKD